MFTTIFRALIAVGLSAMLSAAAHAHGNGSRLLAPGATYFSFGHAAPIIHHRGYHQRGYHPRGYHHRDYHQPRYPGRHGILAPRQAYPHDRFHHRRHPHRYHRGYRSPFYGSHRFSQRFGGQGLILRY